MDAAPERDWLQHTALRWGRRGLRALFLAVIVGFFLYPTAMLVAGAFHESLLAGFGSWSATGFERAYTSPSTYQTLANSVLFVCGVTTISIAVGVFLAWVAAQTNAPGRRLITPLMVLSLVVPPLLYAFGWMLLANRQNGLLNRLVQSVFQTDATLFNVLSWQGMIAVGGTVTAPITYLLLLGPFMRMDQSLEEAARICGASRSGAFFRTTLPLMAPAVLGVAALIMALALQSFDTPQLLGTPENFMVFATQIFHYIYDFTPSKYAEANSLALLLLVVIVLLLFAQQKILRGRDFSTVSGKSYRPSMAQLRRSRYVVTLVCAAYFCVVLLLPLAAVVIGAFQPIFGVWGRLTLDNFRSVLANEAIQRSIVLTVYLSVFGGVLSMVFALIAGRVLQRSRGALRWATRFATFVPWAMPGIVLSLSFLCAVTALPLTRALYGTEWLMLIALTVSTVPIAITVAVGALAQINPELEEAARTAGAGAVRAFVDTVARLMIPSFLAGWFLCGLFISGNLAVPIMLSTHSAQPVSSKVFEMYNNGNYSEAAAFYCVVIAIIAGLSVVLWLVRAAVTMAGSRHSVPSTPRLAF